MINQVLSLPELFIQGMSDGLYQFYFLAFTTKNLM